MKKIFFFLATAILLAGCQEDNWMDWKAQNELWLQQNILADPSIQEDPETGLQYKIITLGNTTDVRPQIGSVIYCDYKGWLINGYMFDSSKNANMTMTKASQQGALIDGFVDGLRKIYTHGDIIIYIPWELGYGKNGVGTEGNSGFIPPYSTLIYEVHLNSVSN